MRLSIARTSKIICARQIFRDVTSTTLCNGLDTVLRHAAYACDACGRRRAGAHTCVRAGAHALDLTTRQLSLAVYAVNE